jgi:D-3-phosphoglycerate dehydrogenase
MRKKILITSKSFGQISDAPLEILQAAGCEAVFYNAAFDEIEFRRLLSDCDGLIIGAHKLSEDAVTGARKLKIVSKHGTGLDNMDLGLLERRGIRVTNVPSVNANAVADLAFGHMLNLARGISLSEHRVRDHEWKHTVGIDVYAKTLALIGFGEIAKNVARRGLGFSMEVLAHDPFVDRIPEAFQDTVRLVPFMAALRNADYLSVHVPLTAETRGMIGYGELKQMKPQSILVNTSRGGIVNEADLCRALDEGLIRGVGLDVLEHEPLRPDEPLLRYGQVSITPHMGMYSQEAINQVSMAAAQNVIDWI